MSSYNWERPAYPIAAVDNALQLVQILRDEGPIHLQDAARRLGVAASTAHRLLAMLVYRGYAVQHVQRGFYEPGPAIGARPAKNPHMAAFSTAAQPVLAELVAKVRHTSHLVVRVNLDVRTVLAVEASTPGHIRSRQGVVMPAIAASGGKVLLAQIHDTALRNIFHPEGGGPYALPDQEFRRLMEELVRARHLGYALNEGGTESAITSIALPVWNASSIAVAAFGLSAPRASAASLTTKPVLDELRRTQRALSELLLGTLSRTEAGDTGDPEPTPPVAAGA